MKVESSTCMGDTVICDQCNKDYTKSKESGGFIFGSHAYCPECARVALPRIESYGEERYIKAWCLPGMSFKDFVLQYRGDNNKVTVISIEDGDSLSEVLGNAK